jgi:hypothetical protein
MISSLTPKTNRFTAIFNFKWEKATSKDQVQFLLFNSSYNVKTYLMLKDNSTPYTLAYKHGKELQTIT